MVRKRSFDNIDYRANSSILYILLANTILLAHEDHPDGANIMQFVYVLIRATRIRTVDSENGRERHMHAHSLNLLATLPKKRITSGQIEFLVPKHAQCSETYAK